MVVTRLWYAWKNSERTPPTRGPGFCPGIRALGRAKVCVERDPGLRAVPVRAKVRGLVEERTGIGWLEAQAARAFGA